MQIKLVNFEIKGDERGSLISLEQNGNIPFEIKRVYYIFDTKNSVRRGYHAHKSLKQILVCVNGSCRVLIDNGNQKQEILLDSPSKGLLLDSAIWREMFDFSTNCVLMVLADNYYDEDDYIRNYEDFLRFNNSK